LSLPKIADRFGLEPICTKMGYSSSEKLVFVQIVTTSLRKRRFEHKNHKDLFCEAYNNRQTGRKRFGVQYFVQIGPSSLRPSPQVSSPFNSSRFRRLQTNYPPLLITFTRIIERESASTSAEKTDFKEKPENHLNKIYFIVQLKFSNLYIGLAPIIH